jgi:GT2 family glycosyltransferase
MSVDISVIIVSWNCKKFLLECLASFYDQVSRASTEVIIVDNASSDGTPEAVRNAYPEVKLIENTANMGFAQGNNIGLKHATGKYICLINPDVIVLDRCIAKMQRYMEDNPDIGMVGPAILDVDGAIQRSCMRRPTLWNQFCRAVGLDTVTSSSKVFGGFLMKDCRFDEICDVDIINGCFWMVRREAVNDVGGLDAGFWMYGDDLDWCQRFRLARWRIVFFPEARAIHYGGGASENAPIRFYVEMNRANLRYWRKYHNYMSYCLYWLLLNLAHGLRSVVLCIMYVVKRSDRPGTLLKLKKYTACLLWLITRGAWRGAANVKKVFADEPIRTA